ncbi:F-box protein CPR1-like [Cucurbita pepo subsp. pepo]|uniref:F-box protein CPR1-like n=1 Tax=Cucurbita pepo subsp. pepo TaxID=3664 RepID=UPI000C9D35EC|nr:F-box protein CPR1-like [Cucurbita pepo subsp. pepo]
MTTEKFRKLPLSILHFGDVYDIDYSTTNAVGFGYDSKSRDFKVVRVVEFGNKYGETDFTYRVEIYDLRKERWREIESPICGIVSGSFPSEMRHEGTYYWWAFKKGGTNIIHTFDMSEEVFGEISIPDNVAEEDEKYISTGILNGSIVIFHYPVTGNGKTFDIWKMEKDVVSWSKLLTIGPTFGVQKPWLFVNSDELLMDANKGQVIYYNIKTHMTNVLPIKGLPSVYGTCYFDFDLQDERESHMNFQV